MIETDFKYEGYAARQAEQNRSVARGGFDKIPAEFDFSRMAGLRSETRQKLAAVKPTTLGQAGRIAGITPADISIIHIWLSKKTLDVDNEDFKCSKLPLEEEV